MRQAATIALLVLCAVPNGSSRGDNPKPSEPAAVTQARDRLRTGDRQGALTLLEDALLDGPASDRSAVLDLLRRTYTELAREAESGGNAVAAAEYRENLAILDRAHPAPRPADRPQGEPIHPRPPASVETPLPPGKDRFAGSGLGSIQTPSLSKAPPTTIPLPELREPVSSASLPEPINLPMPKSLPEPAPMPAHLAGQGIPKSDPAVIPAGIPTPSQLDPSKRLAVVNPGEASGTARSSGSAAKRLLPENPGSAHPLPIGQAPTPALPARPDDLAAADRLFRAQDFDAAGKLYAGLAARKALPEERRPHWAYCRMKAVVRRINANPRSMREWDAIETEVRAIQQLTPKNWYGEYLMNLVTETRRSRRRRSPSAGNMVVRGSSPDGPEPAIQPPGRRRPLRSRETPNARPTAPPSPALPSARDPSLILPGSLALPEADGSPSAGAADAPQATNGVRWQVHESPNFRVYHHNRRLAEQAAEVAESVRSAQARRWETAATQSEWTPRCELYLYANGKEFAEATGQPATAPGLSTISNDGSRVVARRMSLRADNRLLLTATLPHEVTHVVLADLFAAQPIPRWADEGLAVLAEPETELRHREADLKGPLDEGRVFEAGRLLAMDYPDPKDWRLFYAQSVSLTRFLVDQGSSARFIQFLRESQRIGTEAALRNVYQIEGVAALHERWLDYARKQADTEIASTREMDHRPDDTRRD